jgi:hypothetical protein
LTVCKKYYLIDNAVIIVRDKMSEVVHHHQHHHHNNNNNSQTDLTKYNYMCDECGAAFNSLDEYIEHVKHYHPRSIGTAIT